MTIKELLEKYRESKNINEKKNALDSLEILLKKKDLMEIENLEHSELHTLLKIALENIHNESLVQKIKLLLENNRFNASYDFHEALQLQQSISAGNIDEARKIINSYKEKSGSTLLFIDSLTVEFCKYPDLFEAFFDIDFFPRFVLERYVDKLISGVLPYSGEVLKRILQSTNYPIGGRDLEGIYEIFNKLVWFKDENPELNNSFEEWASLFIRSGLDPMQVCFSGINKKKRGFALLNSLDAQKKGFTLLHEAAGLGLDKLILLYLKNGGNSSKLSGLGSTPLEIARSYRQYKVADILKSTELTPKHIDFLKRKKLIKEMGHIFGLRGSIQLMHPDITEPVSVKHEAYNDYDSITLLTGLLDKFNEVFSWNVHLNKIELPLILKSDLDRTINNIKNDFKEIYKVFQNEKTFLSLEKPVNVANEALINYFNQSCNEHRIVTLPTGPVDHSVTLTLFKNKSGEQFLILCNRGDKMHSRGGTVIYKIKPPKIDPSTNKIVPTITEDFINQLCPVGNSIPMDTLFKIIDEVVEPDPIFLPTKAQEYGSCSYVNAKSSIEAILYLQCMERLGETKLGAKEIDEIARTYAEYGYKTFTNFMRNEYLDQRIQEFIKISESSKEGSLSESLEEDRKLYLKIFTNIIKEHHGQEQSLILSTRKRGRLDKIINELNREERILNALNDEEKRDLILNVMFHSQPEELLFSAKKFGTRTLFNTLKDQFLFNAIKDGNLDLIKEVDINIDDFKKEDKYGYNLLTLAISRHYMDKKTFTEIMEHLLNKLQNESAHSQRIIDEAYMTATKYFMDEDIIHLLLDAGCNPNYNSIWIDAISDGKLSVVNAILTSKKGKEYLEKVNVYNEPFLLFLGLEIALKDVKFNDPNSTKMIGTLLQVLNPEMRTSFIKQYEEKNKTTSLLYLCEKCGNKELYELFLEGNASISKAGTIATLNGDVEIAKKFFDLNDASKNKSKKLSPES